MTSSGTLSISVVRSTILGVDVIRGYARLCDLARLSRADIYDATTNPKGTQRDLSPKHAREAYFYASSEKFAFWPELVLNLRDASILTFRPRTGIFGTAEIDLAKAETSKKIYVSRVDGNHRLHFADGRSEGYPAIEREVSFCLTVALDRDEEIALFRDINNNQRRMNTSHLDNITLRLSSERQIKQQEPHLYIAQRLASDEDSPLAALIFTGGKKDVTKTIPLRNVKTGIDYMFSRPSRLTAAGDMDAQVQLIKNYFSAVRQWQPDAWDSPKDYLLLRGAGFWAICFLGAEVIDRALADSKYKVKDMLAILQSGQEWNWHRDGDFKGYSGRAGAVEMRDRIAAELEDGSGVSLKNLMSKITGKSPM
jgi:DGQHR domain-containing protein